MLERKENALIRASSESNFSRVSVGSKVSLSSAVKALKENKFLKFVIRPVLIICLLYLFICSLDLLAASFQLLGGKTAGRVFQQSEVLRNPVCGLVIGVLTTVLVQSSSTSTSILVTMVANCILDVEMAVPIIMGANIGTSLTNTIVSLAQGANRDEFRRAFAGATVHDAFNWLTVMVLLPLECASGLLLYISTSLVSKLNLEDGGGAEIKIFKHLTEPLTKTIIRLDKKVIKDIAIGDEIAMNRSLIKDKCVVSESLNGSEYGACKFIFYNTGLSDVAVGVIMLIFSLALLIMCLLFIVKVLHAMLHGRVAKSVRQYVNRDLPWYLGGEYTTGYVAIVIGALMTVILQSSSVFTSALTPLVGIGVVSLKRMYPLTLGSNIGTTATSLLAAMASGSTGNKMKAALQISLCHLIFNLFGILLYFPVPWMRWPIGVARKMGNITARYKWFAVMYLFVMFAVMPVTVFTLSLNLVVFMCVMVPLLVLLIVIIVLNIMQSKCANVLPKILRNFNFLPECLRSLDPLDGFLVKLFRCCPNSCLRVCCEQPPAGYITPGQSFATIVDQSDLSTIKEHICLKQPQSEGLCITISETTVDKHRDNTNSPDLLAINNEPLATVPEAAGSINKNYTSDSQLADNRRKRKMLRKKERNRNALGDKPPLVFSESAFIGPEKSDTYGIPINAARKFTNEAIISTHDEPDSVTTLTSEGAKKVKEKLQRNIRSGRATPRKGFSDSESMKGLLQKESPSGSYIDISQKVKAPESVCSSTLHSRTPSVANFESFTKDSAPASDTQGLSDMNSKTPRDGSSPNKLFDHKEVVERLERLTEGEYLDKTADENSILLKEVSSIEGGISDLGNASFLSEKQTTSPLEDASFESAASV